MRSSPTTIRLRERTPREVRLSRREAGTLAEEYAHVVELMPLRQPGRYRLTTRGYAGVIALGERSLLIRPKMALSRIFDLLDPFDEVSLGSAIGPALPGLLDAVAWRLAALINQAELHRGYVESEGPRPYLRGRLDVAEQLRSNTASHDQFHCRAEDFTLDHPGNRFPKAIAETLLRYPLSADTKVPLERALLRYAEVASVPLATLEAMPPRASDPLLGFCQLLAPALQHQAGLTFLLNMEQVFERYVTQGVVRFFRDDSRHTVVPQQSIDLESSNGPALTLRPDIVLQTAGRPRLILDAKWKRFTNPSPDDLHQILAYQSVFNVPDVRLVYPGQRFREREYALPRGQLVIHTLGVTRGREGCERSIRRLGRSLRQGLKG